MRPRGVKSSSFEEEFIFWPDQPPGFVLSPKKADAFLTLPFR